MAENKNLETADQEVVDKALGFWQKNSKTIIAVTVVLVVVFGGYFGYTNLILAPKELKASEDLYVAEQNFRKDSFQLALNGAPNTVGFLKVISKYSGTKSANIARLYAAECHLHLGEFQKAIDQLNEFDPSGSTQIAAKAEGLLGDAYAELKKNDEALGHYKNAGTLFEEDQALSSEYLFRGALLAEILGKNDQAIEMYKAIKEKYPRTDKGFVVDKYLARLGVIN